MRFSTKEVSQSVANKLALQTAGRARKFKDKKKESRKKACRKFRIKGY